MMKKLNHKAEDELDQGVEEVVSPSSSLSAKRLSTGAVIGIAASASIVVGILGFVGGIQVGKSSSSTDIVSQQGVDGQRQGGFGGFGGMNRNG